MRGMEKSICGKMRGMKHRGGPTVSSKAWIIEKGLDWVVRTWPSIDKRS